MKAPRISRRNALRLLGATAAGATGTYIATGRSRAQASVAFDELDIPDETLETEDGDVYAPHLLVAGSWTYTVQADPATWEVLLLVGDGSGSWSAIGFVDGETTARSAEGDFSIRGRITAANAYSSEDFSANPDGSPATVAVPVGLLFVLDAADGSTIVEAQVSRTVAITVDQTGPTAAIGARGVVAAQDDQSDPTPTPLGEA